MLNNNEYLYLKDLILKKYNQNKTNYFCEVDTTTNSYNTEKYDITCYFSEEEITVNDYIFFVDGEKCSIETDTYNTSLEKLSCSNFSGGVGTSKTNYIYSNLSEYPDIIQDYRTSLNNHLGLNEYYLIVFLIMLIIMNNFLFGIMKKR